MKITIDWDKDYIDGTIEDKIVDRIVTATMKKLKVSQINDIVMTLNDKVNNYTLEILENFIDRPINVTDKWGEVTEQHESVNELLKTRFDTFISEAVDSEGRPKNSHSCSGTHHSRLNWLLKEKISQMMREIYSETLRDLSSEVTKCARKANETMKKETAKEFVNSLDEKIQKMIIELN